MYILFTVKKNDDLYTYKHTLSLSLSFTVVLSLLTSGSMFQQFRSIPSLHFLHLDCVARVIINRFPVLKGIMPIHWLYNWVKKCALHWNIRHDREFASREFWPHSLIPPGSFMVWISVRWGATWKTPAKGQSRYVEYKQKCVYTYKPKIETYDLNMSIL